MDTDFFESGRREPRKWVSDSDKIVRSFPGFLGESAFALIHGLPTLESARLVARLIAPKSSGTSGRISSRRFDRDRISTAAISNSVRSCCFPSFRSTVIKASNSFSANASRSPFLMPAPTMERDYRNRMSGKIARQPPIDAFVEQNLHTSRFLPPLQETQSPAHATQSEIPRENHRSNRCLPSNQSGSE